MSADCAFLVHFCFPCLILASCICIVIVSTLTRLHTSIPKCIIALIISTVCASLISHFLPGLIPAWGAVVAGSAKYCLSSALFHKCTANYGKMPSKRQREINSFKKHPAPKSETEGMLIRVANLPLIGRWMTLLSVHIKTKRVSPCHILRHVE